MKITSAKYLTSAVTRDKLIIDEIPEICFVGRSNVGKSSLINNLVGIKKLAKTSSTPGLTKMVNYFNINNGILRFVDLPGYGFAKIGKNQLNIWASLMGEYLTLSHSLKMVFVLLDIRHLPSQLDKMMIDFLIKKEIPFTIIATKSDKLSRSAIHKNIGDIAKELNIRNEMIIAHSSETSLGKEKILDYIGAIIDS